MQSTRALSRCLLLVAVAGVTSCSEDHMQPSAADDPSVSVEIGIPVGSNTLNFVPLEPGNEIFLQTFGQGGTHALLAVRCIGFGEEAFVTAWLTHLPSGQRASLSTPTSQLLSCADELACDLMPILIMTGGFGEITALDGTRVEAGGRCRSESGTQAEAVREGVLSIEEL